MTRKAKDRVIKAWRKVKDRDPFAFWVACDNDDQVKEATEWMEKYHPDMLRLAIIYVSE